MKFTCLKPHQQNRIASTNFDFADVADINKNHFGKRSSTRLTHHRGPGKAFMTTKMSNQQEKRTPLKVFIRFNKKILIL